MLCVAFWYHSVFTSSAILSLELFCYLILQTGLVKSGIDKNILVSPFQQHTSMPFIDIHFAEAVLKPLLNFIFPIHFVQLRLPVINLGGTFSRATRLNLY